MFSSLMDFLCVDQASIKESLRVLHHELCALRRRRLRPKLHLCPRRFDSAFDLHRPVGTVRFRAIMIDATS